MTTPTSPISTAVTNWFAGFGRYEHDTRAHTAIANAASEAAHDLHDSGYAHLSCSPGNATTYRIAFVRCDGARAPHGGDTLIAVIAPTGRAVALDIDGHYTPDYIADKFDIRTGDAIIIAALIREVGVVHAHLTAH